MVRLRMPTRYQQRFGTRMYMFEKDEGDRGALWLRTPIVLFLIENCLNISQQRTFTLHLIYFWYSKKWFNLWSLWFMFLAYVSIFMSRTSTPPRCIVGSVAPTPNITAPRCIYGLSDKLHWIRWRTPEPWDKLNQKVITLTGTFAGLKVIRIAMDSKKPYCSWQGTGGIIDFCFL